VTNLPSVEDAVARTVDRFGGIDAAFANAGMGLDTPGTVEATRKNGVVSSTSTSWGCSTRPAARYRS